MRKLSGIITSVVISMIFIACSDVLSSELYYHVSVAGLDGGKIILSEETYRVGDLVEIDVIPEEGLSVETASLGYKINGKAVPIKYNRFYMPAANVTLTANFIVENNAVMLMNRHSVVFQGQVNLDASVSNSKLSSADTTLTWESSNPSVATVDQNGVVTSKNSGKAVVLARNARAGVSAACIVEVPTASFSANSSGLIVGLQKNSSTGSLVVPEVINNVEIVGIAANAFRGNSSIVQVTLPKTITQIGSNAFDNVPVRSINLPDSVSEIGSNAFANNPNLSNIIVNGVSPSIIGSDAFRNCSSLSAIIVPSGKEGDYKSASGWASYDTLIRSDR